MSSVPAVLRSKLLQLAIGFAAGAATYVAVDQSAIPSPEVQLAIEIGAHYESSGRHIGKPYIDKLGKGQPLTVCNGVTGPEVVAGRYYTPADCKRLELPKYLAAEKAAKRLFTRWGSYNIWVRASIIDMIYNLGEATVAASRCAPRPMLAQILQCGARRCSALCTAPWAVKKPACPAWWHGAKPPPSCAATGAAMGIFRNSTWQRSKAMILIAMWLWVRDPYWWWRP